MDTSDTTIPEAVTSLDIEASPEDVWQALTTDDGLAGWMGEGSSIGDAVGDDMLLPDVVTGEPKRGVLDEVTPSRRLGYTWWPETRPERATRVAITLTPCEVGTRVTVIETRPSGAPVLSTTASASWSWRAALLAVVAKQRRLAPVFARARCHD